MIADKVANTDERSIDDLDSAPGYGEPTENSAAGERGEELNRGFLYFNHGYLNGHTDNGDLIGTWFGRQGQEAQARTCWFGAGTRLQFNFRQLKVSWQHVPGGRTTMDAGARADYWVRTNLGLSASVRYGRWQFPVIQLNAQRNVATTVEILFHPEKLFQCSCTNATASASGNGGRP